jgi:HK97 family phage prohead protease
VSGETERRFTRGLVEVRAAGDSTRTIGGYAAKFNALSRNLGGFVERINPGFFAKSEGDGWPRVMARYNHDNNMLLGTTRAGTLRIQADDTGLDYSVDCPTARADVYELVQRGDISESSFAFYTFEDDWSMTDDNFPVRTLLSGQLVDVAPVNDPAYLDTSTGLRSLAERSGADLEEVRSAAGQNELRRYLEPAPTIIDLAPTGGQGDPHPLLALRQRRAELYQRRTL